MALNMGLRLGDHIRVTRAVRNIPDANDTMTGTIVEGTMGQVVGVHHDTRAGITTVHADIVDSPDRNVFWKLPSDAVELVKRV